MIGALRFRLDALTFLDAHDGPDIELSRGHVLVSRPETLGTLFRSDHTMVTARSGTMGPIGGRHSLLFANGERHALYRRAIGGRLRGRVLGGYHEIIRSVADSAVRSLDDVVDLPEWSRAVTLRIISLILFGQSDDGLLGRFNEWLHGAFGSRARTLTYRYVRPAAVPSPWRTFQRRRAALCDEVLALRPAPGSVLEALRDGSLLGRMSDEDLTDQILSLLFAGHETTASSITSALYWLSRDPALRGGVTAEARSGDTADPDQVPLLEAVCRETLRLSPPAMVAGNRVLPHGSALGAAGTRLTPCIYAAHRSAANFPEPHRFDPARFLGRRPSPQRYLPFGGGVRRCLGADLAALEMRMIVGAVVRRHDVRVLRDATFGMRGQALCFGPNLPVSLRPAA